MDKKVYYGEYTLRYWIELLLKKDLELPPYQRSFVWTEEQVKGFIKGIAEDGFVPPVTIGVCNFNGSNHNLILDGQQRLSSLLLAYFKGIGVDLIDFKLEFGKTADGTLVLADEISPDTCRFWDSKTHEKLDKDRFRRDLGGVEDAYQEMRRRLGF